MRRLLHILTTPDDALADKIISLEAQSPEHQVTIVDLTKPAPDYRKLLEEIFAADSIQVW